MIQHFVEVIVYFVFLVRFLLRRNFDLRLRQGLRIMNAWLIFQKYEKEYKSLYRYLP
jgi:hypothetical protein